MTVAGDDRFFRELAEHGNDVLWMFSADWSELLYVNSAYEDIFGQSVEQLRESPADFFEAIHPDDRPAVRRAVEQVPEGTPIDIEFRVNETEEFTRMVWVDGEPIQDSSGEVVRIAGIARDVTDRRERQQELERYRTIVQTTDDPVYTLDEDGVFTFVNAALGELAGYDPDEMVGQHASIVLSDDDVERSEDLIASILEGEAERGTYEMDLRTADGRRYPVENHIAVLPSEEGFRGTVGVLRDLSERKARERELERQVDRFEAIFQTIPEPLVHVIFENDEPIVQRVNPAFTEVFGLDADEVRGQSINDAIVPPDRMDEAREIDEEAQVGDTVEREVRRMAVDGIREFRFRVNWFEVVGEAREAIGTYVDLSDEKRRQRELERQNARLEEFASVVSHDLRNPLNVIQGRAELARDSPESENFDAIERAADRMEVLIEDLLSLARAGATVDEMAVIELGSIVESCWHNVVSEGSSISLESSASIMADENRLQQLFENLFRNAIQHGGEDLTVTVGTIEDGFFVEDDGKGIPPDEREKVFERGYTTTEHGTGLGLRIVRTITDAHGWQIRLTDSEAGGARFEITDVEFA